MAAKTLDHLQIMKKQGEKIAMLTAYDASFAKILDNAGVDVLLVGDTLGMVVQGLFTTIPVTLQDIVYHTRCVARGNRDALLMADLPFLTYATPQQAMISAGQLMQAGAAIIKLEGGDIFAETIRLITQQGIPVCAHLGLTPQSIHSLGGFKVQGKYPKQAQQIRKDALLLQEAGARMLILECIPYVLAQEITESLTIPVLGIGAGPYCDGQVLVTYDLLGLTEGKPYTFVKNFLLNEHGGIPVAVKSYVDQVKKGVFPGLEHSFS